MEGKIPTVYWSDYKGGNPFFRAPSVQPLAELLAAIPAQLGRPSTPCGL
ncbi:hypothetical protein P4234_13390 [Pseudomonas aeruginosa]|nr:hypothetical protein [Pseudomonas aeruginosa]